MSATQFADGFQAFTENPHNFLYASNLTEIWAFEKTDGSILGGGKLATISTTQEGATWQVSTFPAIREPSENIKETLFSTGFDAHLLLTLKSGEAKLVAAYQWDYETKQFKEYPLEIDSSEVLEQGEIDVVVAEHYVASTQKIVILSGLSGYHFYLYDFLDDRSKITGEYVGFVEANGRGRALNAFSNEKFVYFTFGREGCGFRWDRSTVLRYDLIEKELTELPVAGDGPTFLYDGAASTWYIPNEFWGFCVGRHTGGFDGQSWVIEGLEQNELRWVKRDAEFESLGEEEDYVVVTSPIAVATYLITKEKSLQIHHN
ncbi:unnamed protein product [Caenorhabditis angaria]|uniref:Uncharacterized protein n=1 Tax=Caenorhabditis angaria TaxID=860376 RepID=A0A9P1IU58_9PELO|nr:unnamed protein product [Caenorhabditis angaria]